MKKGVRTLFLRSPQKAIAETPCTPLSVVFFRASLLQPNLLISHMHPTARLANVLSPGVFCLTSLQPPHPH
jgi:hypothetical protein